MTEPSNPRPRLGVARRAPPPDRKPNPPHPAPAPEGERLAKRVAAMVPCSRSQAEQYIEGGWVSVDGRVVEVPEFRVLQQKVAIDPHASLLDLSAITLLVHKPADWLDGTETVADTASRSPRRPPPKDVRSLLTAANRAPHDASGVRLLQRHFKQLTGCVPLESGASGLVVLTQDWRVQRKLQEDQAVMENELIVEVRGEVSEEALRHLLRATDARGQPLPPTKVSINSTGTGSSKLRFAIKGAHPGLVAYRCDQAGLEIISVRRIRLGRVALSDLPVGHWRYLAPGEKF